MPPVRQPILSNPESQQLKEYIRSAAEDFGETKFALGSETRRVNKHFNVDPRKAMDKGVWWYLEKIAETEKFDLFYSRDGFLTMRERISGTAAPMIFTWDDVVTAPTHEFDITTVKNRVEVYSKDKRGTDLLKGFAELASAHPLSPDSLARNGKCFYLLEEIKANHLISKARATQKAVDKLDDIILNAVDVSFEGYPVPFLEPGDRCSMTAFGKTTTFTVKQYTLPLFPSTMSVGYTTKKKRKRKQKSQSKRGGNG
jgi:hypothetical protein